MRDKVLLYLIPLCISTIGVCSCGRHVVEDCRDMEIYVGESSFPAEYQIKGQSKIKPSTNFPIYNTVIFYPEHNVYTFQVSNSSRLGTGMYLPEFLSGRYVTRNDTIICIPDIVYKKNPEDLTDYKIEANDTVNLQFEPSLRPIYFLKVSKNELMDVTPSYGVLFDAELDYINEETGYEWTMEDFEFNKTDPETKARLKILSDKKIEEVIPNEDKDKKEEVYRVYHRVPFKVKKETVTEYYGLNTRAKITYYKPLKQ